MSNLLVQLGIGVFGLGALVMALSSNRQLRWWAPFVGLAGQPFWFVFAWGNVGPTILVGVYTIVYLRDAIERLVEGRP